MKLYYLPISTYSQKVLIALYEKNIEFEASHVNLMDESARNAYREIYPMGKIPLLIGKDERFVPESSVIIEYLDQYFPGGVRFIPEGVDISRQVRFIDRMIDLYFNESITSLIFHEQRTEAQLEKAKQNISVMYQFIDDKLKGKTWLFGDDFTMADCSCIPPLAYAKKLAPFDDKANIVAYYERAMERPSVIRVMEEAEPVLRDWGLV